MRSESRHTRAKPARKTNARSTRAKYTLEKSAGAVVFQRKSPRAETRAQDAPEYLLIYSSYWEFPKGGIDTQESETDAALREVREETGLNVQLVPGFREEINYFYRRRESGTVVKKQVVYFLGETAEQARAALVGTPRFSLVEARGCSGRVDVRKFACSFAESASVPSQRQPIKMVGMCYLFVL